MATTKHSFGTALILWNIIHILSSIYFFWSYMVFLGNITNNLDIFFYYQRNVHSHSLVGKTIINLSHFRLILKIKFISN